MNSKRIEKRFEIIRTLVSIGIALCLALVVIILVSDDPANALYNFLVGPTTSFRRFANVIELAIPLTFTGLAVSVIFTADLSNMASEGAFFMAATTTTMAAVLLDLPPVIHPIVCLLIGTVTGMAVTSIPAILKVKWGANELVSSLMLNYICLYISTFFIRTTVMDPTLGVTGSVPFKETASLPGIVPTTRLHVGLFFVIIAVILCWFMMYRTKLGYSIRMVGQNPHFAKYAGIGVGGTLMSAQLIGGGLAGFGGATEMLGMYTRFQYQGLTQYGFDGMLIAIIAQYNPAVVPVAAFFLAYMRTGADIMNRNSDVPLEIISVIQAIIIMLVVAKMFLNKFKHKQIVKYSKQELQKEEREKEVASHVNP